MSRDPVRARLRARHRSPGCAGRRRGGCLARVSCSLCQRRAAAGSATGRCRSGTAPMKPCRLQRSRSMGSSGSSRLDGAAALVARRPQQLLDERLGHEIDVVLRVDHEQIDGADVAAGPDGGSQRQHRAPGKLAATLGHEDAGLGQVHELTQEIWRDPRIAPVGHEDGLVRKRNEPIDVRDAGGADLVFHADGSIPRAEAQPVRDWRATRSGTERPWKPAVEPPSGRRARRPRDRVRQPPTRRPTEVLHSARRCL